MKKIVALIAALVMAVGFSCGAAAAEPQRLNETIERIKSLNIMAGYEDGSFGEDKELTRAEFAAVIVRLLRADSSIYESAEQKYSDVGTDHWAKNDITLVTETGYMQGYGNGSFGPEDNVTYNQTIIVLIRLLGYEGFVVSDNPGDVSGYIEQANQIGLLKNANYEGDEPINRGDLAMLLSNALDTRLMVISNRGEYEISEYTLLDRYMRDGEELEGVVWETSDIYLVENNDLRDGEVIIDGVRYNSGDSNIEQYVGMNVHFFVQDIGNGEYVIQGVYPDAKNEIMELSGKDVVDYSNYHLIYRDEKDRERSLNVSSAQIICNGGTYYGSPEELLLSPNTNIRVIDNNDDGGIDYIFAEQYEIAQIARNNTDTGTIYLRESLKNGSRSIEYTDDLIEYDFVNLSGEQVAPEDINEEDSWIEIYERPDGGLMKIIALDDAKTGYVEMIDNGEGVVTIDGTEYIIAEDHAGFFVPPATITAGENYEFCTDSSNRIIYMETAREISTNRYGYVYGVYDMSLENTGSNVMIKLVNGTTIENYEENDKYYIHGKDRQEIEKFDLADKVNIDGTSYDNSEDIVRVLSSNFLDFEIGDKNIGNVIKYQINSENEINKIEILMPYGRGASRTLNAEQMVLGGDDTPFGMNEDTVVFFIPRSGMDEDISCDMRFGADSYNSVGYELDDEEYTVSCAVIESPLSVYDNSDFSETEGTKVVQAVSETIDENGDIVYRISGYDDTEIFNCTTRGDISAVNEVAQSLKQGDVIQFQTDFDGQINRIKKVFSFDDAEGYYHQGAQTANEIIYGIATQATSNYLGVGSTEFVDQLGIALDELGNDETVYQFPIKESTAPDIYIWYRSEKRVMPGEFEDIVSMNDVGSDGASNVILYASNSVVRSILILN